MLEHFAGRKGVNGKEALGDKGGGCDFLGQVPSSRAYCFAVCFGQFSGTLVQKLELDLTEAIKKTFHC